jgi:hypothetical protein
MPLPPTPGTATPPLKPRLPKSLRVLALDLCRGIKGDFRSRQNIPFERRA